MNKSITQANQNDKQISKSIKRFFIRFHISSALKASNAYKKKGIPVVEVFQYLFLLIFSNRSMYMSLITGRNTPGFAKDTVYRFMKMIQINWIRFTTLLASRIIKDAILPLDSKERTNVLIIDDSMFERNRSKKVELLAKAYDHANHRYRFGFRMLTLGWSDGSTFLPVNSVLLSSENKKNRVNEAADVDKRTVGYKRRMLSMQKGTIILSVREATLCNPFAFPLTARSRSNSHSPLRFIQFFLANCGFGYSARGISDTEILSVILISINRSGLFSCGMSLFL